MAKKNKIPAIRFKGFAEDWEIQKLKDVSTYSNGGSFENDVKEFGRYELITLKSINMSGKLVHSGRFIDKETPTLNKNTLVMILSEQSPGLLGMTAQIPISNRYVLNQRVAEIRPNHNVDSYFLSMAININQPYFSSRGAGTKVQNISKPNVENYEFSTPLLTEQKQIGAFFQNLDKLITEHQKKHDKLVILKKAMLEKMFPKNGAVVPEIRFKGFSGDWEEKRLGNTKTYFTDGNYGEAYPSANDLTVSGNGVPFLRGSNLSNGILSKTKANYITNEKHLELTSGHLVEDDIVITVRGSLGSLGYVNKLNVGWNINSQLAIIRTNKKELKGNYLIQYLLSDFGQRVILSKSTGTALKQLPIAKLKEMNIPLTNVDEQQKIGNYFKNLDSQIVLHKKQLEKLKNIKKACFTKMFVSQE